MRNTNFRNWAITQHDIVANQKYDDTLLYSFHLKIVESNVMEYEHLLSKGKRSTHNWTSEYELALDAAIGHDLIEDARVTYNDIVQKSNKETADIIFCLTDEKGKNRNERHSGPYFDELVKNEIAVFVKLCDIMANLTFSIMTNSSMARKYKSEYPKLKEQIYIKRFDELFMDIEKLLTIIKL